MIRVRITWDPVNGDFDSDVTGDEDALVAVTISRRDDGTVLYANDTADPDDGRYLYWHELDPDAAPDPERPCPDDCLACEATREEATA